jgi:hypothetical protein
MLVYNYGEMWYNYIRCQKHTNFESWCSAMTKEEQLKVLIKKLQVNNEGLILFDFNGMAIIDPFVDDTGRYDVDPIAYYGYGNMLEAFIRLTRATINNQPKEECFSMLDHIAKALKDFSKTGTVVITSTEHDVLAIASYVLDTLNGLKCSIDHYYNDVENSYFIFDNMNER